MLFVYFPSPHAWASEPLSALVTAQKGVDACDSDLFNQAVDVPSVVNKASDSLIKALRTLSAEGTLGDSNIALALALAGMAEQAGQADIIRQLLVSEVRGFVAAGINGGYFAGRPNNTVQPPRGSLASTLDKLPPGRREIVPGRVLSDKEGKAVVSGVFVDPQAGRLPLELALELRNGQWRIVEITNAQSLFEEAARRNQERTGKN